LEVDAQSAGIEGSRIATGKVKDAVKDGANKLADEAN
jgi:hypothetical protein